MLTLLKCSMLHKTSKVLQKKKVNRIVDYTKKTLFFLACKIIITIFRLR